MPSHFRLLLLTVPVLFPPALVLAQAAPAAQVPEVAAPTGAAVDLASAIEAARAQFDGGVLEAELETEGGRLVWEIDLVRDGSVHEANVDAQSGEVLSIEEQTLTGTWLRWFGADRLQAAQAASGTLGEALTAALERVAGQPAEVELEEEDGRFFYAIEIATAPGSQEVRVDTATGEVQLGEVD